VVDFLFVFFDVSGDSFYFIKISFVNFFTQFIN